MVHLRKYAFLVIPVLLLLFVFIITYFQHDDPDMYIHLSIGNIIVHQGIVTHEILSQAGPSRPYIPYEWLFQLLFYQFVSVFGFSSYHLFIAVFSTIQIGVMYLFLRRIVHVDMKLAALASLSYTILMYPFLVARPQIVIMTFLIISFYLLLKYFLQDKNYLYLLFPLGYVWANIHASVVISILLCFLYCFICCVNAYSDDKKWFGKAKTFALYGLGLIVVTILPPQGLNEYKDIWLTVKYGYINSAIINEWAPLYEYLQWFIFYICIMASILTALFIVIVKKKVFKKTIWLYPFILFIIFGFTAVRNVYLGYFAITIILAWTLSQINLLRIKRKKVLLLVLLAALLLGYEIWIAVDHYNTSALSYQEKAADFIKKENLQGNMFNQLDYGGYLEYRLYPDKKVFIDGRNETFYCCELNDLYNLEDYSIIHPVTFKEFRERYYSFFNKEHISYVVLVTKNDSLTNLIVLALEKNPQWINVYRDDVSQIFVKNDGKNTKILDNLGELQNASAVNTDVKLFTDPSMNIQFDYPTTFTITRINPQLILLNASSDSSFEDSLVIYSAIKPNNTKVVDLPYLIPGTIKQSTPIMNSNFEGKLVTYSDGKTETHLLFLQHERQLIFVRYPTQGKMNNKEIIDITNSIKVLH